MNEIQRPLSFAFGFIQRDSMGEQKSGIWSVPVIIPEAQPVPGPGAECHLRGRESTGAGGYGQVVPVRAYPFEFPPAAQDHNLIRQFAHHISRFVRRYGYGDRDVQYAATQTMDHRRNLGQIIHVRGGKDADPLYPIHMNGVFLLRDEIDAETKV